MSVFFWVFMSAFLIVWPERHQKRKPLAQYVRFCIPDIFGMLRQSLTADPKAHICLSQSTVDRLLDGFALHGGWPVIGIQADCTTWLRSVLTGFCCNTVKVDRIGTFLTTVSLPRVSQVIECQFWWQTAHQRCWFWRTHSSCSHHCPFKGFRNRLLHGRRIEVEVPASNLNKEWTGNRKSFPHKKQSLFMAKSFKHLPTMILIRNKTWVKTYLSLAEILSFCHQVPKRLVFGEQQMNRQAWIHG